VRTDEIRVRRKVKNRQADRLDGSALVVNAGGDGDKAIVSREK